MMGLDRTSVWVIPLRLRWLGLAWCCLFGHRRISRLPYATGEMAVSCGRCRKILGTFETGGWSVMER